MSKKWRAVMSAEGESHKAPSVFSDIYEGDKLIASAVFCTEADKIVAAHNTPTMKEPDIQSEKWTAEKLKDEYTFSQPCCVDGEPDAHTVWIKIGDQSFSLDGYFEKEVAEWMRLMLGKAFEVMLDRAVAAAQKEPDIQSEKPKLKSTIHDLRGVFR